MIDYFLGDAYGGFVLAILGYCSPVWCSAADTHLKQLDRAVSGARFLTGCVFECDIAQYLSMAVLYMLYKIRCNPMHPLNGTLPWTVCDSADYTRWSGFTSIYLCAASLQNLAVPHDFYSSLVVPLE